MSVGDLSTELAVGGADSGLCGWSAADVVEGVCGSVDGDGLW